MPPIVHTLLLMFAFVCFVFSAWQSNSQSYWNRITSVGLAALVASMLPL